MPVYTTATASKTLFVKATCEACHKDFSYQSKISSTGTYNSYIRPDYKGAQDYAKINLNAEISDAKYRSSEKDFSFLERNDCPHCGYIQSWMVKGMRRFKVKALLYASLILLANALFWPACIMFSSAGDIPHSTTIFFYVCIGLCLFSLLSGLGVLIFYNPNRKWLKKNPTITPIKKIPEVIGLE
jgi:hypothetical protein